MSTTPHTWKYLARKPGSSYEHLFVKDRWISARTIYGMYVCDENPMTVEEISADYGGLPVEAIREAIAYCESNPPELAEDMARQQRLLEATGMDDPEYWRKGKRRVLTPQEWARIRRS